MSLSILVSTCSAYKDTWPTLAQGLENIRPDLGADLPVHVVCTNPDDIEHIPEGWHPIHTQSDLGWSDNLIRCVESMTSDYILLWLDDIIPVEVTKPGFLKSIKEFIGSQKPSYLRLSPKPPSNDLFVVDRAGFEYFKIGNDVPYRNSTILALWHREALLKVLRPGETAWQFEVNGSRRSTGLEFFCLNSAPIKTVNLIVKGYIEPASMRAITHAGLPYSGQRLRMPLTTLMRLRTKELVHHILISSLPPAWFTKLQAIRHNL